MVLTTAIILIITGIVNPVMQGAAFAAAREDADDKSIEARLGALYRRYNDKSAIAPPAIPTLKNDDQESMTLRQILVLSVRNNPSVIEGRKRWEEKKTRIPLASAQPNPQIGIMKDDIPTNSWNPFDAMMTEYTLTQEIMNPAKLKAMKKMATSEAEMANADYLDTQMEIYTSAKQAYYDVLYNDRALEIGRANQELMEQLVRIAQTNYSTGMAPLQEVLRAQTEFSMMGTDLLSMASMSEVAKAKLNTIMGRPSSASLNVKEEFLAPLPDFDLSALKKDALAGKPAVVSMERQVDMARNGVLLAQKKRLPDFQFSIGYKDRKNTGGDSESDSVEPDPMDPMRARNVQSAASGMSSQANGWKVELMVMLPLWGGLNKAEVKAAEAGVDVARASLDGMKSMTDLDLQMALTEAQSAWRQIGLYENVVIPQAEQTYQAGVVSYTNGQVDFMAVLDSFNALRNSRLDHYKARVNYEKAIAELEKAAGKPLLPLQIDHNE